MLPIVAASGVAPWQTQPMPAVTIDGNELVVTLERNERTWGILPNLRLPVDSVSAVEFVDDGRGATSGIRSPGLGGTQRLIGTWRAKNNKQYVCVRRGQPAVKITLGGQKYQTILIGLDDAKGVVDQIRRAAGL